jgi:hypothetical protein
VRTTWARIKRIRQILARYASEGYLRGRGMQVAGIALLADGVVGLENPLDGKKSRSGVLGALVAVVVCIAMLLVVQGARHQTEPYANGAATSGIVSNVLRGEATTSRKNPACTADVTYSVDGENFTVAIPGSSTSLCTMQGAAVEVSYRASEPAAGRAQLPADARTLGWVQAGLWLVTAFALVMFLTRIVEIVVGISLLVRGRGLAKRYPAIPADAVLHDLRIAWSGSKPTIGEPVRT